MLLPFAPTLLLDWLSLTLFLTLFLITCPPSHQILGFFPLSFLTLLIQNYLNEWVRRTPMDTGGNVPLLTHVNPLAMRR